MNVGTLREAIKDLPEDMEITAALGFSDYVWGRIRAESALMREHAREVMIGRGKDPSKLDKIESPYKTLNRTGLSQDIQWVSLSDPDFENNRIALEF